MSQKYKPGRDGQGSQPSQQSTASSRSPARTGQRSDRADGDREAAEPVFEGAPPTNRAPYNCNNGDNSFKALRWGVDSLYLSYPGELSKEVDAQLKALKELAKSNDPAEVAKAQLAVGGHNFEVKEKGASLFPYILEDGAFRIQLSRPGHKAPMAYVKVSAKYLAHVGPVEAEKHLYSVLSELGEIKESANVSRIDLFVDFQSSIDMEGWDRHAWVTRAASINAYAVSGQFSGWSVGLGGVISARLYNKLLEIIVSGKEWIVPLWQKVGWDGQGMIWRVEFEIKREVLTQKGLSKLYQVLDHLNGLWSYATTEWLRLTIHHMSLFKRKDSSCWWVKIIIDGRKIQRSTGTEDKIQAQEFHDRLKAQMWEQNRLGVKARRSWKEAVVRWLEETSEKATHQEDKRKLIWLDTYLGALMLDEITLDVIDSIRAAKLKEAAKATTNRYLALTRSILLRSRDEWEWIDKVPKVRLFKESASRERSLTREQAGRLLDELPEHQRDVVLFALATGLRQSNVLQLEWSQINLEQRHAWIHAWQSKNRRPISIPLNEAAYAVLLRQKGKHLERVFTFQGRPLNTANTRAWRKALQRAGIDNFRWHDLRHTWATWQRQAGTPTHELQRLGGWRTGAMVERYAHLAPEHLAEAASRLNSVLLGYDSATVV